LIEISRILWQLYASKLFSNNRGLRILDRCYNDLISLSNLTRAAVRWEFGTASDVIISGRERVQQTR